MTRPDGDLCQRMRATWPERTMWTCSDRATGAALPLQQHLDAPLVEDGRQAVPLENGDHIGQQLVAVRDVGTGAVPEVDLEHAVLNRMPDVSLGEVGDPAWR